LKNPFTFAGFDSEAQVSASLKNLFPTQQEQLRLKNMDKITKTSTINITVGLDDHNVPVSIAWLSDDGPTAGKTQPGKAMLLSLFDSESLDTLKIDLWTKDMQVKEMDRFFYQTLRALTETYFKATQNQDLAGAMQSFVQYFGEKTEIIPPLEKG